MPPHCDTLDGPVVTAARKALETGNVNLVLPWAPPSAENELKKAFTQTLRVRKLGKEAAELADYWFFETLVRVHRQGEGAPYTGLKPAGLDWGPVVPRADEALDKGNAREVIEFLQHVVSEELGERFNKAISKKNYDVNDVPAAREYVQAMLGFVLFAHHVYAFIKGGGGHGEEAVGGHQE